MPNEQAEQGASFLYIPHGGGPLPLLADRAHLVFNDAVLGKRVLAFLWPA